MGEILGYARVSTSDQSRDGQIESIREHYPNLPAENIYADIGSGDDPTRDEYVDLRERLENDPVEKIVAAKLDRLGRSTAEVADFVDTCADHGVGLHLVQQGFDVHPDNEMGQMMLKFMSIVAEMELKLNRERRQEGIERAIDRGVQFGQAPHGMTKNEMGVPVPGEGYERVQAFIREVKKGRSKRPTARFFDVPEGSIATILDRADELYGVAFDNDEWKIERARVEAGEKGLAELGEAPD
ncbi:recombinase family protein [Halobellus inordinatus]|uniref:recombinase family protein n=1 Tax=Halobellus inordinatus TaxID=1126236 RepID=UPI002114BBCA|nr:recombinase family protein [Halobellus ramosii]